MLRLRCVPLAILAVALLVACGGGDDEDTREARATARSMRIQTAMMAEAARRETPAYACLRSVSTRLMETPTGTPARLDMNCLAGIYVGKTPQGRFCELRVASHGQEFSFHLDRSMLQIGPEPPASAAVRAALRHGIEQADVEFGQIGVRLLRGNAATAVVETMVLAGGPLRSGTADLTSIVYERVAGARVHIERCYFDT